MRIKLRGSELSITSANTVGGSKFVRVYAANTAAQVLTVTNATANVLGTCTVGPGSETFIIKEPTDLLILANGLAVGVAHES